MSFHRVNWVLLALLLISVRSELKAQVEDDDVTNHFERTVFRWTGFQVPDYQESDFGIPFATDRPDFTEAASTVGRNRVQLETGYRFSRDNDTGSRVDSHAFAEQLWRIGIGREWLELRLAWNYFSERSGLPGQRDTVDGGDDLQLGFKIALTEQVGWLPAMALIPQAFLPTGAESYSSEEVLPGLNWVYSWDIKEGVFFGGSTQVNRVSDDVGEAYSEWAQSLTFGMDLNERLGVYGEWYVLAPHAAPDQSDVDVAHYLNGGFTFMMHEELQFDIRAGMGLNRAAEDLFVGTGLSRRW